jgi:hypothetical protein
MHRTLARHTYFTRFEREKRRKFADCRRQTAAEKIRTGLSGFYRIFFIGRYERKRKGILRNFSSFSISSCEKQEVQQHV